MIRLNAHDFDNSLSFCGRGDEKNNFLINQYIKTQNDRDIFFTMVDKDFGDFNKSNDSLYAIRLAEYSKRKSELNWSNGFDTVAKSGTDLNYYHKKELYPFVHQLKTQEKIYNQLPQNYYDFRQKVDFNNQNLVNYSPYIKFVTTMLNNMVYAKNNYKINDNSLENNIYKLHLADSLLQNTAIKNTILNNIAYMYLIENQNMYNNEKFIERYLELSTDKEQQKEVSEIFEATQKLKIGNRLPNVSLMDSNSNPVDITQITNNKPTVLFFWSNDAKSHLISVHNKIKKLEEKYPTINFIGINLNDSDENWKETIKNNNLENFTELKAANFEEIRKKWVITKVHRIIILNADGSIKNGFANLYEPNFEKELQ